MAFRTFAQSDLPAGQFVQRLVVAVIVAGLGSVLCIAADKFPEVGKNEIMAKWSQRQQQVKSASFKWMSNTTMPEDYGLRIGSTSVTEDIPHKGDVPLKNIVQESPENWFRFDGSRVSLTTVILDSNAAKSGHALPRYRSAFDGVSSRAFEPGRTGPVGQGTIYEDGAYHDLLTAYLLPFFLAYRTLDPKFLNIRLENYDIEPGRVPLQDRSCILLIERPNSATDLLHTIWVDPERDCIVLRNAELVPLDKGGRGVAAQVDISYSHDETYGWIPSDWTSVMLTPDNGALIEATSVRIVHSEFNIAIPDDEFRLPFPPQTYVIDNRSAKKWIELPNGERRMLTDDELIRGPSHQELLETKPGKAGITNSQPRFLFRLSLFLACVVALSIAVFIGTKRWPRAEK